MPNVRLICVRDVGEARCTGDLGSTADGLTCSSCGCCHPVIDGVPVVMPGDGWEPIQDAKEFYATYMGSQHTSVEEFRRWAEASGYQRDDIRAVKALVATLGITGPSLEVGCSGGLFAEILPGYVGLDYSLRTLITPGWEHHDRVNADAARLPFAAGSFELIISISTLEHVSQVDEAMLEIDRVLRPGGTLYLRPAWHCTRYNNELIPVLPYASLTPRQRLVKASLPVLQSKLFRALVRVPHRAYRRMMCPMGERLHFKRLTPNYGPEQVSDQDACCSIDPHEVIRFFLSRGYRCLSHPTILSQLVAGGHAVVLQKPQAGSQ